MKCCNDDSLYGIFSQVLRFHYYRTHMLLEKVGVYPGQPPLLFALHRKDGISQTELSEKLHLKGATVTVMLKRMEQSGLVERRRDETDKRIGRVYLTDRGKKILREVEEALKAIEEECFNNFTVEEQILLRRLFMQMRDNLAKGCGKSFEEHHT